MDNADSKGNILIIDDSEMSGLLAKTFLRKSYNAVYVTDTRKAIEMMKSNEYHVILLDLDLGAGIRGEDVLQEIRQIEGYVKTPVIALTGFSGNNENITLLKLGFNGYMSKPYTKKELLDVLEELLGQNQ